MPQISTKPAAAKQLMDAGMPKNISAVDKAALIAGWEKQAADRESAIARETKVPEIPGLTLRYELRKFGKHWNGYAPENVGKSRRYAPLLNAPSLLSSAIDALTDRMSEDASKL